MSKISTKRLEYFDKESALLNDPQKLVNTVYNLQIGLKGHPALSREPLNRYHLSFDLDIPTKVWLDSDKNFFTIDKCHNTRKKNSVSVMLKRQPYEDDKGFTRLPTLEERVVNNDIETIVEAMIEMANKYNS